MENTSIRSTRVSVPVLWNAVGDFLNNTLMGVDYAARVVGYVDKPAQIDIPGHPGPTVQTLEVKDSALGVLYLSLTIPQWLAAIGAPQEAPGISGTGVLTSGVLTVLNSNVTLSTKISVEYLAGTLPYPSTIGSPADQLVVTSITPGISFTIKALNIGDGSTDAADSTSQIQWSFVMP